MMSWLHDMRDDSPASLVNMQRHQSAETSTIANSAMGQKPVKPGWYRDIRMFKWVWQGLEPILLQEVLARIAASENPRSHPDLIDTVVGYRPGNWIYEWSQEAALRMLDGKEALKEGKAEHAHELLLQASLLYTIAGYPHLRGDKLASDAHLLANQAYQLAGTLTQPKLEIIQIPYQGKQLQCYLHRPPSEQPVPVVIVAGGGDALQTDYLRIFQRYLEPAGVALLTVDMPGIGYAEHWTLQQDTSELHRQVLEHMATSPFVLKQKMALLGVRTGGHAAVRAAFMAPEQLAAVAVIGAVVHDAFVNPQLREQTAQMVIDELASRLGLDAANQEMIGATLGNFSLRRQGLLGVRRTQVPMLAIAHPHDPYATLADAKLIASSSYLGQTYALSRPTFASSFDMAFAKACDWLIPILTK